MPLVTQDKSSLYGGVSQQAANSRLQHFVEEMINCIPTLDSGLRVRNPSLPIRLLDLDGNLSEPTYPDIGETIYVYEYDRGSADEPNNKLAYLITPLGGLEIIDLNFEITDDGSGTQYLAGRIYRESIGVNYQDNFAKDYILTNASKSNFSMTTVKDSVFVVNKSIVPEVFSFENPDVDNFVTIGYDNVIGGAEDTVTGSNGSFQFTVPKDVTEVDICMVAGGGGARIGSSLPAGGADQHFGGGHAGEIINQSVAVTAEGTVDITIGQGGATQSVIPNGTLNGLDGEDSVFGTITASGGAGGDATGFLGNGQKVENCAGEFEAGEYFHRESAGALRNVYTGEPAGADTIDATTSSSNSPNTRGSGGTGVYAQYNTWCHGGGGGNGMLTISWSDINSEKNYQRKGFIWVKEANPEFGFKYGAIISIENASGAIEHIDCGFTEDIADGTDVAATALGELIATELDTRAEVVVENSVIQIYLTDENEKVHAVAAQDSFGNQASYGWAQNVDYMTDLPKDMGTFISIVRVGESSKSAIWFKYKNGAWLEHHDPFVDREINNTTMPYSIIRKYNADSERYEFYVERFDWDDRLIGDNVTNPLPQFIGTPIKDIFFFRNRLGLMTSKGLAMSEVGYYGNFFRTSVASLLDSDRINTAVESQRSVNLEHAILLEDSVMMFSDKAQFRFRGGNILSPSSYTITQELAYDMNISVRPLLLNNRIYFITRRGAYSAVHEMIISNQANQDSVANDITVQCQRYVAGNVDKITGSSANNMIFVTAGVNFDISQGGIVERRNTVYMYKFHDSGRERVQSAWSKWVYNGDVYSGFCLGTSFYTMINRENRISPSYWILSSGRWNNSAAWIRGGIWVMSPDSLERQKQFEFTALHPIREDLPFLDNYNQPVQALVELGEWIYGTDGKRSPSGDLQFRTAEIESSRDSEVAIIVNDLQRNSFRSVPSEYVKNRRPYIGGNAENIRLSLTNGATGKGFRIEAVSFEGTVTKRSRSR